jgi:heterodisulfide reductase subunit C
MIQLGQKEELLKSKTIWICASCQTCTTRCPNDIDIAHTMDGCRKMCRAEGVPPAEESVPKFHDAFLEVIRSRGRIHEIEMVLRYKFKTKDFFADQKLGMVMFKKGKLKLKGHTISRKHEIEAIFQRAKG